MADFLTSDGLRLSYRTWGPTDGTPVVLHHGFAANASTNWESPGVVAALVDQGRRVVAIDARGHGASDKPHDPARYGEVRMAQDLGELVTRLGCEAIDLVGYSMGAVVSLVFASTDPRVRRLVVGGVGEGVVVCGGVDLRALPSVALAEVLEADLIAADTDPGLVAFRAFAELMGSDRLALAAQARSMHRDPIALDRITVPTLVLAGDADPLAAHPDRLRQALPDARLVSLAGDHLGVVRNPEFARAIVDFVT
ncbi:Tropinesterase [Brevundimonas sp. NIBR10]|uniref:alpha/beta fold hydrolase n=1 Tax=Brevundimonas sp. NIBR10 TaxID=3015997 RepID=UPI0022F151F2|nr:alpha/beta fold hydrolase [Brevundimonas sp. NIBR10]WGM45942.1 Tropinesterase [Brevundimonas sp. NIBR10]